MTLFHFICLCGNALEVEAASEFVAEKGVERSGWLVSYKGLRPIYKCEACRENPGVVRETGDQEIPR
jgi:hypothetical protein